ncbi:hypothetical protein TNCV_4209361 [Trichonephila clavipes]|nr:hypothetical protein TNCV_4209361 [Trichonephila clavipes]
MPFESDGILSLLIVLKNPLCRGLMPFKSDEVSSLHIVWIQSSRCIQESIMQWTDAFRICWGFESPHCIKNPLCSGLMPFKSDGASSLHIIWI